MAGQGGFGFRQGNGGGQIIAFCNFVYNTCLKGGRGRDRLAGQDETEGGLRPGQARQALRASAARNKTEFDLRQAKEGVFRSDPVMTGERDLQSLTER